MKIFIENQHGEERSVTARQVVADTFALSGRTHNGLIVNKNYRVGFFNSEFSRDAALYKIVGAKNLGIKAVKLQYFDYFQNPYYLWEGNTPEKSQILSEIDNTEILKTLNNSPYNIENIEFNYVDVQYANLGFINDNKILKICLILSNEWKFPQQYPGTQWPLHLLWSSYFMDVIQLFPKSTVNAMRRKRQSR